MKRERRGGARLACWLPEHWGHYCKFSSIHLYLFPPEVKQAVTVKLSNFAVSWGKRHHYLPPSFPPNFPPAHELTWVYLSLRWGWELFKSVTLLTALLCKSLLSTIKHSRLTVLCTRDNDAYFSVLIMFVLTVSYWCLFTYNQTLQGSKWGIRL